MVEFFQHTRAGEAESAWKCWDRETGKAEDVKYDETQVRNTIAQFRLEQALEKTLPPIYEKMKTNGALTPTPERIGSAKFTTFRRLAIVRWSDNEDAGLPLDLDTGTKPPKWLISTGQYRATARASVGDSFRNMDLLARTTDSVAKDVLDGKVKTAEDLEMAGLHHLDEQLRKLKK